MYDAVFPIPCCPFPVTRMVEGEGFEPSKAEPADLQSAPFDRSGTPPSKRAILAVLSPCGQTPKRRSRWGRRGPKSPVLSSPCLAELARGARATQRLPIAQNPRLRPATYAF